MPDQGPMILNEKLELQVGGQMCWGSNVVFGPNCRRVEIGYGGFIGNNVYIDVEELKIGDYFTLHAGSVMHGKICRIGHNNWIGQYVILDALGGKLILGNNVGIGAHSQLWSHMKFGDRLEGCRWYSMKDLIVEDDVWFVGHCIVTAIRAERRSMLLVGGVAVENMASNHVYGGSPAVDMTEKLGPQFREDVTVEEKQMRFTEYIREYEALGHDVSFFRTCADLTPGHNDNRCTWYCLATREYLPRYCEEEYGFMRFLLYEKAKFTPKITEDR